MKDPKISVIIPCYNVEAYIRQCLDSLRSQTLGIENLELIVVNDASKDGTLSILLEYEKENPEHMTVINLPENQKQGKARNIGMQYARGKYIGFVDSDDWIEPEMYQQLYEKAVLYDCDMVSCGLYRNYTDGNSVCYGAAKDGLVKRDRNVLEGNTLIQIQEGSIVTKIFKKAMIVENDLQFPEGLCFEDNYWYPLAMCYVRNYYLFDQCYYHYRENPHSTVMEKNQERLFDRLEIEEKKLRKMEMLGVRQRFQDEIEMSFISLYYTNTLVSMARNFETVPYERFLEICEGVKRECPGYRTNPYLDEPRFKIEKIVIQMLDMNLSREEFQQIMREWKECGAL